MSKRSFYVLFVVTILALPALADQPHRGRERNLPVYERIMQILKKLAVVSLSPGLTEPKP
ncbi:MAG TPA: hypothetical protein VGF48_07115 [Thermoanaerobaculia bacterium]